MVVGIVLLFALQAALMFADERLYHRRRGLDGWERWGHPVDSLVYVSALAVPALAAPHGFWVSVYTGLAVFSCLLITKDEWVHARSCTAGEHWLHAMLFLIHPSVLIFTGLLWIHDQAPLLRAGLPLAGACFFAYQIAGRSRRQRPARTPTE